MSPEVWGFSDCLKDCAIEHEQSHIKDILIKSGNVCKRKDREGWRVVASSTSESHGTERKAYGVEYRCLAAKLEKECEDGPCYSEILERMTFVLTEKKQFLLKIMKKIIYFCLALLIQTTSVFGHSDLPLSVDEVKEISRSYLVKEKSLDLNSYQVIDISFSFTKEEWFIIYQGKDLVVGDHFFVRINSDKEITFIPGL